MKKYATVEERSAWVTDQLKGSKFLYQHPEKEVRTLRLCCIVRLHTEFLGQPGRVSWTAGLRNIRISSSSNHERPRL